MQISERTVNDHPTRDYQMTLGHLDDISSFRTEAEELNAHYHEQAQLTRLDIAGHIGTPWGTSQSRIQYAPGIEKVTTASHGGFIIEHKLNDEIDARWRISSGQYEEDICWAIVAFSFPQYFTGYELKSAIKTLRNEFPDPFERITGTHIPMELSEAKRRQAFTEIHRNSLVVHSARRSPSDDTKVICKCVVGAAPSTPSVEPIWYLVDLVEYQTGQIPYGFIIDVQKHTPCTADGLATGIL